MAHSSHFDRSVQVLGHGDHHWGTEDPKDVVKEEPGEQSTSSFESVELEDADTRHSKREGEDIRDVPGLIQEYVDHGQYDGEWDDHKRNSREGDMNQF